MKQNKKTINEAQLRAIVSEAVRNVLKEGGNFGGEYNELSNEVNQRCYNILMNGGNPNMLIKVLEDNIQQITFWARKHLFQLVTQNRVNQTPQAQ